MLLLTLNTFRHIEKFCILLLSLAWRLLSCGEICHYVVKVISMTLYNSGTVQQYLICILYLMRIFTSVYKLCHVSYEAVLPRQNSKLINQHKSISYNLSVVRLSTTYLSELFLKLKKIQKSFFDNDKNNVIFIIFY